MENVGICRLSTSMLNFLVVAKYVQIWYNSGAKLQNYLQNSMTIGSFFMFSDHFHFPGFPVSVGTLLSSPCLRACSMDLRFTNWGGGGGTHMPYIYRRLPQRLANLENENGHGKVNKCSNTSSHTSASLSTFHIIHNEANEN